MSCKKHSGEKMDQNGAYDCQQRFRKQTFTHSLYRR